MIRAFLIAGEASGDALGAGLVEGLQARAPGCDLRGIAGARMQAAGMGSLFPMDELSVMGLAEILPRYRQLRRRLQETVEAVLAWRPDVLITIDLPEFSLRVARQVRARDPSIRTVHYVAPSVWAWRPGRAARLAGEIDQLLALLPFEPPLFETHGLRCDFVGHPVASAPPAEPAAVAALRAEFCIADDAPLVLVLPGSRRSEVARLAPVFGAALGRFAASHPGTRALLPVAYGRQAQVSGLVSDWPVPVACLPPGDIDRKRAAFAAADIALAASGTVSLELAAAATPMVIGYRMNWLTMQILRRMARVDTVTLVNLVSATRAVPEYLGADCTPDALAAALAGELANPESQRAAAERTMTLLGRDAPPTGLRAATAILDGLGVRGAERPA